MRKKVDSRVRTLIENGVKTKHRSFFVLVGDKGRDQVVNLHYMLSKAVVKSRPSVLWCYKKELGFSSNRKKRMKHIKQQVKRGLLDPNEEDPFELFISSTDIRYTYYKETHKILGNTYGMCVLQDFEAITPNVLARTMETVEGGGIIVLLLKTMTSLKQLYTMTMDCHSRYRTDTYQKVVGRFNERFLLSLATCKSCLVMDDELNILPISSVNRSIKPVVLSEDEKENMTPAQLELLELKDNLADVQPVGALVETSKTLDQAKTVMMCVEAISEKTLRSTVAITAGRGRGKSAALGMCIAAAVAYGYSNIFVTSPSPENLKTLFEFVFKGFDKLGFAEHADYEAVQSIQPEFKGSIVRINIFKQHRQTIQYILPNDHQVLAQAELLVIDEAAAIPLPIVKKLMGPYLVFMSSTINGYEGTGRSLSLKLINTLREQSAQTTAALAVDANAQGRTLREVAMQEPIRYGEGDAVEKWLNTLLCLDCEIEKPLKPSCPHPNECQLYFVNRDTLFSFHKAAESFLRRMMALYVSSHYKNSPDDLQLLSDAPAHQLFVLLGPVDPRTGGLPEILCVVQIALEGHISRESMLQGLSRGERMAGDLIPWTMLQQYQDTEFGSLSGARVVRIATNPQYTKMGYASRTLELLAAYYSGSITNLTEGDSEDEFAESHLHDDGASALHQQLGLGSEDVAPRKALPPLLSALEDRAPERLHYVGVSFGLTQSLFGFWAKNNYSPVYLRQTSNDLTGEHTCIMLHPLDTATMATSVQPDWLKAYVADFQRRFSALLSYQFSSFPSTLALRLLPPPSSATPDRECDISLLKGRFTPFDMKRLEAYTKHLVDYHVIMDLMPSLAHLFFVEKIPVTLAASQSLILLGLGLQHKTVDDLEKELSLPSAQILALFSRIVIRCHKYLLERNLESIQSSMLRKVTEDGTATPEDQASSTPAAEGAVDEELEERQKELLADLNLEKFRVEGDATQWESALSSGRPASSVSVLATGPKSIPSNPAKPAKSTKGKGETPGKRKREKHPKTPGGSGKRPKKH